MKKDINSLRAALIEFDQFHKRTALGDLAQRLQTLAIERAEWSAYWSEGGLLRRYTDGPCVYFFFDKFGELYYIGQTKILGNRFGAHFSSGGLGNEAASVAFLPIEKEYWFEILSIEAYLIEKLQPKSNKLGTTA